MHGVKRKRKRLRKRKRRRKLQAEQRRQHQQEQNALSLAITTDNSAAEATGEVDTPICAENELVNHQKKKRQLDEGNQGNQKRPRHDTVAPVLSAVQLWLRRLANAEPFVSKRPGVKMLQYYGSAFKVVDGQRLWFKEWRAGQETADRPACELCYVKENLATVATITRDREWPTVCARHATLTDCTQAIVPAESARTETKKAEQRKSMTSLQAAQEKDFVCAQCGKCFARHHDLKRHMQTHTGEKPFACTECDKRFGEAGHLKIHMRTHTGEKPFACTKCDSRFTTSGHLKDHMRTHTGEKPYACTECDSRFTTSGTLKNHLRTHTGEKPFACTECDYRCTHAGHLKIHMRTHTGEKPFACTECDSRFTTSGTLKEHMRTHTGDRPFACTECGARFTVSGQLKAHERRHEESKKWEYMCAFASFSTTKFQAGLLQCTTRCKTERLLDDHVQRCHTSEGIAKRFKSEQQLAEFLAAKGWAFDRDFANAIFYKHCDKQITPKFVETVSSRPDFHLLEFQSLPSDRKCMVLLGNDEFAHRRYRCELGRMLKISTALAANPTFRDLPIIYVRFNPHWFEVDGVLYDPPLQSRFERLQRLLTDLQGGRVPEVAGRPGLSFIYLYYERQTTAAGSQPWQRLAGGLYDAAEDTGDGNSEVALALRECVVLVE